MKSLATKMLLKQEQDNFAASSVENIVNGSCSSKEATIINAKNGAFRSLASSLIVRLHYFSDYLQERHLSPSEKIYTNKKRKISSQRKDKDP